MAITRACATIALVVLSVCGVQADNIVIEKEPARPSEESKVGYLIAAEDCEIPVTQKGHVLIPPRSNLSVLADAKDHFLFLAPGETADTVCRVPKKRRHVVLMKFSSDAKKAYFSGAVYGEAQPVLVKQGVELPIVSVGKGEYVAKVPYGDSLVRTRIRKDNDKIVFSKGSRFDKYAARQEAKGLALYEGQWLNAKEVAAKLKHEKELRERQELHWQNALKAARRGFLVLRNGKTLKGKLRGIDRDRLLFETEGIGRWLKRDEIANVSPVRMVARGKLADIDVAIARSRQFLRNNERGNAMREIDASLELLGKIGKETPEEYKTAQSRMRAVRFIAADIMKVLEEENCALYQYIQFPKDELEYHLEQGHMLFRDKIWLKKEQLCQTCKGKGGLDCETCKGRGSIMVDCPHCEKGLTECPLCHGKGERLCPRCRGGAIYFRTCPRCRGKGTILKVSGYRNQPVGGGTHGGYPFSNEPRYIEHECPSCAGLGELRKPCPYCHGRGKVDCSPTQKCEECDGKGETPKRCPKCNGKKILPCTACNGKGFTGKPQVMPK